MPASSAPRGAEPLRWRPSRRRWRRSPWPPAAPARPRRLRPSPSPRPRRRRGAPQHGAARPTSTSPRSRRRRRRHDVAGAQGAGHSAAGNWGYTTAGGRRFALTGTSTGTSIVEVTDPARPRNVAPRPGPGQPVARDPDLRRVRLRDHGGAHGLDIIGMADPDHPRKVRTWNQTFRTAHSLWIDTDRGLLFVNGTPNGARRRHARPRHRPEPGGPARGRRPSPTSTSTTPTARGQRALRLRHQRRLPGPAGRERPAPASARSRASSPAGASPTTPGSRGTGATSSPPTSARPPAGGLGPRDARRPAQGHASTSRARAAIPHNVMIDGDRLLVSHYTEGVHLLDIRNPEQPRVLGFYDTYPGARRRLQRRLGGLHLPGLEPDRGQRHQRRPVRHSPYTGPLMACSSALGIVRGDVVSVVGRGREDDARLPPGRGGARRPGCACW